MSRACVGMECTSEGERRLQPVACCEASCVVGLEHRLRRPVREDDFEDRQFEEEEDYDDAFEDDYADEESDN